MREETKRLWKLSGILGGLAIVVGLLADLTTIGTNVSKLSGHSESKTEVPRPVESAGAAKNGTTVYVAPEDPAMPPPDRAEVHDTPLRGPFTTRSTEYRDEPDEKQVDTMITAIGIGYPPNNVKEVGRRDALAKRAAKIDGLRNLAENVQLHLRSNTTIRDQMVTDDEVRTTVDEILKGVVIIREEKQADGGFEVTVGIPITTLE
jgi:hypothetical protein